MHKLPGAALKFSTVHLANLRQKKVPAEAYFEKWRPAAVPAVYKICKYAAVP
jgi:hypothetical protein